jgi:hypothetical protein
LYSQSESTIIKAKEKAMRGLKAIGLFLLIIWLLITNLLPALDVRVVAGLDVLSLIAVLAGVLLLLDSWRGPRNLGLVLLGVWLIIVGLLPFLNIRVPYVTLPSVSVEIGARQAVSTPSAVISIVGLLTIIAGIVLIASGVVRGIQLGLILLGVWMLLSGLLPIIPITIPGGGIVLALIGIVGALLAMRE